MTIRSQLEKNNFRFLNHARATIPCSCSHSRRGPKTGKIESPGVVYDGVEVQLFKKVELLKTCLLIKTIREYEHERHNNHCDFRRVG